MNRIYHTWEKWECYRAGFFEVLPPKGLTDNDCLNLYRRLLLDTKEFKKILRKVIKQWRYSCEHNLTNERMNRIAWMGQAALCYKYKIPSKYRGGYHLLSDSQKLAADKTALVAINEWMKLNKHPRLTLEEVLSKTEVDLY